MECNALSGLSLAETTFLDLTPEEREKCRTFWSKFRALERIQVGSLLIFLLFPTMSDWLRTRMPVSIWLAAFTAFLVAHVWLYALDCPRCGVTFSGGLIALLPRVRYPWRCYGCDLSRRELKYIDSH
jgi:hypothetical protein